MQRGLGNRKAVCPSVRLSVSHTRVLWQNEVLPTFLYHMKDRSLLFFRHDEWLVGDVSFYLKFWAKLIHPLRKRRFSIDFSSYRLSLNTVPSEKSSIITDRKSTTGFPMSLRWTSYGASNKPLRRGSKTQNGRFSYKNLLFRRKSVTTFLYLKTVSGKVVRHSLTYTVSNRTQVACGGRPLKCTFCA